jgi:hypothetical protein
VNLNPQKVFHSMGSCGTAVPGQAAGEYPTRNATSRHIAAIALANQTGRGRDAAKNL